MWMSKHEALAAIAQIENLCQDFGYPNHESKRNADKLVTDLLNDGPDDSYYRGKLSSIRHWTDVGFSHRKFQKYPNGISQVKSFLLGDCSVTKDLVEEHWPRK